MVPGHGDGPDHGPRIVRRWMRHAGHAGQAVLRQLGKTFTVYPQGRTVGVVWYVGI